MRAARHLLPALAALVATGALHRALCEEDDAMRPGRVIVAPGPEYAAGARRFQGIPGIERAHNGRLWAVWYAGGTAEGPENYVVLATSADGGETWSGPRLVIDPEGLVRAYDACLWLDPQGRLWLFWAQAAAHWDGRGGVWAMTATDPGSASPRWSAPRRLADGVMMNKPTVLRSGAWLFPVAVGTREPTIGAINERLKLGLSASRMAALSHDVGKDKGACVFISQDRGRTVRLLGYPRFVASEGAGEHMIVERKDGSLWMLARTRYGIGSSTSTDGGRTWSAMAPSGIPHPPTRFFVRRLASGALLLVKHAPPDGKSRSHLTAYVSDDDGAHWEGGLLLDERNNISYPDGIQAPDGGIRVVYDRERFTDMEILLATFSEQDARAGRASAGTRLKQVVNHAGGRP